MRKFYPIYFILPLLLFFSNYLFSQKSTITGAVVDTNEIGLPFATVSLLQAQDSLLASFATTNDEGRFVLKRVPAGNYLLQVSYIGFETAWKPIEIKNASEEIKFGKIKLRPAEELLSEVEVTAEHVPLRMNRDTLEYNADAFKVQPGSVVEDLLKKLPGVEVERDGSIKAQGEQVQNVLVDGKEFFGNDPKIATKNLPANAVDKVQVYDKKSDMAEFTGIEDGRDAKTINLELKDGKKNGYFGNASAGAGAMQTQEDGLAYDRYEGKFNINRFSKKSQLSAIGMLNNINQQGFSFDEYIRFMGGLSSFMSGGGGGGGGRMRLSFDPMSMGIPMQNGGLDQGFTTTSAIGLNLNHEFNKKTELNASYFYSDIENELDRIATKENIFGENNFTSEDKESRVSRNKNHRLNATLRHKIDSFQNIIIRANGGFNNARLASAGRGNTFGIDGLLQNESLRDYGANSDNFSFRSDFTYRRKFQKKGRAFFASVSLGREQEDRNGTLKADNLFYENEQIVGEENTDQNQVFNDDATTYGINFTYTEPIGKSKKNKSQYLAFTASRQNFNNKTRKEFFDQEIGGEVFNSELSNRYDREYIYDRGGLNLMVNRKKYNLTFGTEIQHSRLNGHLLDENMQVQNEFTFFLPSMYFNYDFGTAKQFNIEYITSVREPSLEQLQPLVDNSDPLNIYAGNPDLQPEYMHLLEGSFMLFDQFTFTSLFANISASYTEDRITNASSIDSLFRQFITPVNVAYDYNLRGGFQFSTPLRPVQTNIKLSYSTNWNRGILFINNIENEVARQRHSLRISLDNRKKNKIDFTVGGRTSFNKTDYSISEELNQNYIDGSFFTDLIVTPSDKWELSSSFDYTIYSEETFGESRSIPVWKASLTRYILKNKRGRLSLTAFDILNRNIGINRNSQLNYVQEERVQSLARHIMLNFAYSISGFKKDNGGIEISIDRER
ncbi:MAG: TonB-dependent receptor [Bacteroidota bacterium]